MEGSRAQGRACRRRYAGSRYALLCSRLDALSTLAAFITAANVRGRDERERH